MKIAPEADGHLGLLAEVPAGFGAVRQEQSRAVEDVLPARDLPSQPRPRENFEGVLVGPRLEHVRDDHGVVEPAGAWPPRSGELPDLRLHVVGEKQAIPREELAEESGEILSIRAPVSERDHSGRSGLERERHRLDRPAIHSRLDVKRERLGTRGDEGAQLAEVFDPAEIALDRRLLLREILLQQGVELEPREEVVEPVAIRLGRLQGLEVDGDRKIAANGHQIAREIRGLAVFLERFSLRRLFHFAQPLVESVHRAELRDQRFR
jgi:hypothetical protein